MSFTTQGSTPAPHSCMNKHLQDRLPDPSEISERPAFGPGGWHPVPGPQGCTGVNFRLKILF